MRSLDRAGDAIDLVAATVDAPRLVEHAIFGEDLVDGRAPTPGVVFTEDVVKITCQQGRYAVGHSLSPLFFAVLGEMSRNLFRLRGSQSERLLRTYTAHRHAFDTHDIHVGDADESEDRAEIRLMKIERRGRAIGKHAATRQRQ